MYSPNVGKLIPVRPASHFKCQNAVYTTTPPGTVANACYTRVIWLATGKCRTISMQAKPRAYQRQIQNKETIKNRQATMLTWNLCVRPACWILSNQRKPRTCRDKKSLATTRDNHQIMQHAPWYHRKYSFKPTESRTLLTLKMSKHTTNRLIIQSDPISF